MIATSNGGAEGESGGGGGIQLKKGPWTAAEDAILVEYVRKHGEGNWNAVQRNSGLARCGKSCRLRWANHLRPNLKKGAFSPEEERLIVELHAKYGNKWARMAGLLPGRTDNEIKNYWNTRVKRHQRQGIPLYPPDIQPQHHGSPHDYHHDHQHQYHHHSTPTTPTTPTSQSTFIFHAYELPSPTTPAPTHSVTHASPTPSLSVRSCPSTHSPCTTPTSSFTFQPHHQLPSPTTSQTVSHATTPLRSPLSPSYTVNTTSISGGQPCPTLPLLDFSFPRPTPILQAPMRFKRFSSSSSSATANDDNCIASNNASSTHFSLPLSPVSSCNTTPLGHQMPGGSFTGLLSSSSTNSEFLSELQRENQKMCELFAAVTQPELPSYQLLSPSYRNANSGITIPALNATACDFGRSLTMKANCNDSENGGNGRTSALKRPNSGSLEDLALEARALVESGQGTMEPSHLVLQEQGNNPVEFEGFGGDWDDTNSLPMSLGLETKVESGSELDRMEEDLTALVNCLPYSTQGELYRDNGDVSNEPSSVVTEDNLGFDMQQIASLFPMTDNTRNLGSFSGYNLPRRC